MTRDRDDRHELDPTLAAPPETADATHVEPAARTSWHGAPSARYRLEAELGRGGMGEVVSAHDEQIGRSVAIKRLRSAPTPETEARFLREARIQGRLDHPAVVPVHELGRDDRGQPYFAMKQLTGKTLAGVIEQPAGERAFTRNQILRALIDVCLAVHFAHERGVVHRDLKPSNIMLGGYGEVYVIDWGIARVIGEDVATGGGEGSADIETIDGGTKTGAILGTPGYMAPEQIRGHAVTEQADIYSLGAILFEILAGEPAHPRGASAIGSTLGAAQVSPAERRPDRGIAPELDALTFQCLAELPERRPTAHELAERVQAFLDGDRDLVHRRRLAGEQMAAARAANEAGDRALAMQHAGRATALDPQNLEAVELLSYLVLQPPVRMPPALAQRLDDSERQHARHRSSRAQYGYLAVFAMFPLLLLTHVQNWTLVAAFYGLVALGAVLTRMSVASGEPRIRAILVVLLAGILLFSRIASPFVLTPTAICIVLAMLTPIAWVSERPRLMAAWAVLAVMLPFVIEWIGVLPTSWWLGDDRLVIDSTIVRSDGPAVSVGLIITNLAFVMVFTLLVASVNRERRKAERAMLVQSWHLEQLLPVRPRT